MVCTECRRAKVKCENATTPCVRCTRLSLECIPHESRQGQGPKKRKAKQASKECCREDTIEAQVVEQTSKLGSCHYGLHFVIRHWISFAMSRRSFSLLDRASSLACRCGITMDQVLCGENDFPVSATSIDGSRMMSFLPEMILKPSSEQKVGGDALNLSQVPNDLLEAIDCLPTASRDPEIRWIAIRELRCGVSRYYLSAAMQQDIVPLSRVQETWKANQMEVNDLWLVEGEQSKFSRGFNQQIAIHKEPFTQPMPTSIKKTRIRLASGQEIEVDCVITLKLVNLDHAFLSIEYYCSDSQETAYPDAEIFGDMSFLDSLVDELEATGEVDELLKAFDGFD